MFVAAERSDEFKVDCCVETTDARRLVADMAAGDAHAGRNEREDEREDERKDERRRWKMERQAGEMEGVPRGLGTRSCGDRDAFCRRCWTSAHQDGEGRMQRKTARKECKRGDSAVKRSREVVAMSAPWMGASVMFVKIVMLKAQWMQGSGRFEPHHDVPLSHLPFFLLLPQDSKEAAGS